MIEIPAFHKVVSQQSEASFVDNEKKIDDIQSVKNLIEYGLPVDVRNAYDTSIELKKKIPYDLFISEQIMAKAHIEAASELFASSYRQSVVYEVEDANRILRAYPRTVFLEASVVISILVVWQADGSASLEFQTEP